MIVCGAQGAVCVRGCARAWNRGGAGTQPLSCRWPSGGLTGGAHLVIIVDIARTQGLQAEDPVVEAARHFNKVADELPRANTSNSAAPMQWLGARAMNSDPSIEHCAMPR